MICCSSQGAEDWQFQLMFFIDLLCMNGGKVF
jgi:hypothetical protein